jgi:predicted PurR-regulated permease PerM
MTDVPQPPGAAPESSSVPSDRPSDPAAAIQPAASNSRTEKLRGVLRATDIRVAVFGLFILATLYTLHFARDFLLPIVLALFLDFLLRPIVRVLSGIRVPEAIGAGLVLLTVFGVIGYAGYQLSGPAAGWIARAPESFTRVEAKLRTLRRPMQQVTQAAERVEEATTLGSQGTKVQQVQIQGPSLVKQLFGGTSAFLTSLMVVLFAAYFLLAAGDLFLQKLVTSLPQFRDKRTAVLIARETEAQISGYLVTVTAINIGMGLVTGLAMWVLGMPNPTLWGVVAGVLNFVPYIGGMVNLVILALAAILTFDSLGRALLIPGAFLVINIIEGNVVTPMILGRRMRLNTVAVFLGLLFWWYIWGIPGAIIAVPLLAATKIVSDHVQVLRPVGEFLGE